jgi:hypothetical protein
MRKHPTRPGPQIQQAPVHEVSGQFAAFLIKESHVRSLISRLALQLVFHGVSDEKAILL